MFSRNLAITMSFDLLGAYCCSHPGNECNDPALYQCAHSLVSSTFYVARWKVWKDKVSTRITRSTFFIGYVVHACHSIRAT